MPIKKNPFTCPLCGKPMNKGERLEIIDSCAEDGRYLIRHSLPKAVKASVPWQQHLPPSRTWCKAGAKIVYPGFAKERCA